MVDVNFRLSKIPISYNGGPISFSNSFECDAFPMTGSFISSDAGVPETLISTLQSLISGEIKVYEYGYNTHRIFASADLSIISFPIAVGGEYTDECIPTFILLYMLIQWKDFIEYGEDITFKMRMPG